MRMIDRFHARRESVRRARAIERALRATKSPAVRDEILAIAHHQFR